MGKTETPVGTTHAAHETRHLARKMELVRNGGMTKKELEVYKKKLVIERDSLITRLKDCWSYLGGKRVFDFTIPSLTKEVAAVYVYPVGLEPMDFISAMKLEMSYQYNTQPPTHEHLHTAAMLMAACIRDLAWAIAEVDVNLYGKTNE